MSEKVRPSYPTVKIGAYMWLIYANPDEGSYGYNLIPYASRYARNAEIPDEVIDEVLDNATQYYPIVTIDGYNLESFIDKIMRGETSINRSWGTFPRNIAGGEKRNSIEEFKEDNRGSEAVLRRLGKELDEIKKKKERVENSIKYHEKNLEDNYKEREKLIKEIGGFRLRLSPTTTRDEK